jgi:Na+/proline symporter
MVFSLCVLAYAIYFRERSIYEMVSAAYQVTLVGSFVPLVFGLYWKRATSQGAIASIALGMFCWIGLIVLGLDEAFPAQLAGVVGALVGMFAGSLLPQWVRPGGVRAVNHLEAHA